MHYDFHPIFVHFPAALLTVYTLLEIIRVPALQRLGGLQLTKFILMIVGVAGACASLVTGNIAADSVTGASLRAVVDWHEFFAYVTTALYGILALSYIIRTLNSIGRAPRAVVNLERAIFKTPSIVIVAILAFLALLATGILGGSLVYGTAADPLVTPLYKLLSIPQS